MSVATRASTGLRLAAKRCGDSQVEVGDEVGEEDQSKESSGWYAWRKRASIGACSRSLTVLASRRANPQPGDRVRTMDGTSEAAAIVRTSPSVA